MTQQFCWRVAGSSVAGSAHRNSAAACQDHCLWEIVGPYIVAAVADGAGSADHSALGAQLACTAALETLHDRLVGDAPEPSEAVHHSMSAARSRLQAESLASGEDLASYACTLLVAAAGPTGLFVSHIGDGCCVVELENGGMQMISEPQNGEFVNVTAFITDCDAACHIAASAVTAAITGWALLTDGLYALAIDRKLQMPHSGFFRPLLDELASDRSDFSLQLDAWLRSDRIARRTDDDLTLFLATRLPR